MKASHFLLLSLLFLSTAGWTADKHGGQEVVVDKFHLELVVKDRALALYVRDEGDKPIDLKGVKATANVFSGKDKATVELVLAGDALRGEAPFPIAKDARVVVNFAVGGGKQQQARFSLGAKQDHKGHKH